MFGLAVGAVGPGLFALDEAQRLAVDLAPLAVNADNDVAIAVAVVEE